MPSRPPAEMRGVSVWFGAATALDRVDLAVAGGRVHGLLGPNGSGKTTLLSVLFGLVLPGEGEVRLAGRTRAEAGPAWLDGVGGFVESPRFYPYLSGRRNLALLAALDGTAGRPDLDGSGRRADIEGVLTDVGLADVADSRVRGWSLGMRQRLGLAAAMLRRPRLLVLDEPTNGLDPAGVRDLRVSLRRLAADGVAVLLSSHDVASVEDTCDDLTVLAAGRVVFAGTTPELLATAPDPVWRIRTGDDDRAAALTGSGVRITRDDGCLLVAASQPVLDEYVLALGRAGVPLRALALDASPLAAAFFALTEPVPA